MEIAGVVLVFFGVMTTFWAAWYLWEDKPPDPPDDE